MIVTLKLSFFGTLEVHSGTTSIIISVCKNLLGGLFLWVILCFHV